jgi:hypothetical protein
MFSSVKEKSDFLIGKIGVALYLGLYGIFFPFMDDEYRNLSYVLSTLCRCFNTLFHDM